MSLTYCLAKSILVSLSKEIKEVAYLSKPTAITDLPDYKHYEQVAKAMAKTGYVTESEALIMMGQTEG